eukprot:12928935-Prorocentrum_lima.AAC.1
MGEKRKHPGMVLSRKLWMQHYMKVPDVIKKKDCFHQTSPFPKPRAKVVQSVEEPLDWSKMQNDQIMTAL